MVCFTKLFTGINNLFTMYGIGLQVGFTGDQWGAAYHHQPHRVTLGDTTSKL